MIYLQIVGLGDNDGDPTLWSGFSPQVPSEGDVLAIGGTIEDEEEKHMAVVKIVHWVFRDTEKVKRPLLLRYCL